MNTTYQHLGLDERAHIQFLLERGLTIRAIARDRGVSRNTVRKVLRSGETTPRAATSPWGPDDQIGRLT